MFRAGWRGEANDKEKKMSNYPPGVTGNERQIAGDPEGYVSCGCEEAVVMVMPPEMYGRLSRVAATGPLTLMQAKKFLKQMVVEMLEVALPVCPFEGDVTFEQVGPGLAVWDCPVCGSEHQEGPGEIE